MYSQNLPGLIYLDNAMVAWHWWQEIKVNPQRPISISSHINFVFSRKSTVIPEMLDCSLDRLFLCWRSVARPVEQPAIKITRDRATPILVMVAPFASPPYRARPWRLRVTVPRCPRPSFQTAGVS
jgi:hypothetical protein